METDAERSGGDAHPFGAVQRWAGHGGRFLAAHGTRLWWLHSAYALALGIAAMWLGARHYAFLRLAFAQVVAIWVTSLLLPRVLRLERVSPRSRQWLRVAMNYVHRNFYQQVLFFILPVYYASATLGSRQAVFLALLALAAVLSTLDVVYDRHVSARPALAAALLAFSVFVCVNVALPVLWSIGHVRAMRIAAALAALGFATVLGRWPDLRRRRTAVRVGLATAALVAVVELARPLVPPAPLTVARAEFGLGLEGRAPVIRQPVTSVPPGWSGRLFVVTAVRAPLGLEDRIRHRWWLDGRPLHASPFYRVTGGRPRGYRLWTSLVLRGLPLRGRVRVDVETEGGQLVGRATVPIASTP